MMSSRMLSSWQREHILLKNLAGKTSKRLRLQIGPHSNFGPL
ncbi:hypothetical protein CFC21_088603, partial [Triticum aestivum]